MPFDDDIKNESMTATLIWTGSVVALAAVLMVFMAA